MANGELTNILVSTDVTRYLEFRSIAGSYVQQGNGAKATVAKVPSDAGEALRSPLMGLFEKRRAKKFLDWVGAFKEDDPASYGGRWCSILGLKKLTKRWNRPEPQSMHNEGSLRQVRP
jgi:Rab GDP dissociation inhibitor